MKSIVTSESPDIMFDKAVALSRVGGDAELLKEIAVLFLDDYPNSLSELRLAVACGDAKRVERSAHGIKGSVSNFGARPAVDAAMQAAEAPSAKDSVIQTGMTLTATVAKETNLKP